MAVEVLSENPSPRISFSYDLPQSDVVPVEEYIRTTSAAAIDFDFCVFREDSLHESSSADELFSDGKILPVGIKKPLVPPPSLRSAEKPPHPQKPRRNNSDTVEEKQKSFWRFKRSSSLNCGSGYGGTLCPLPLMSRSSSTGSSSLESKRPALQKQGFRSQSMNSWRAQPKPPLKRSSQVCGNNGVKFNPVLHISSANLFGLGSIFSIGKDRNKKKH